MSRRSPERPKRKSGPGAQETGELRLIGGRWRSRKLTFPAVDGVRPTPARTRETLFNWLAPCIEGACCLDLFAGSGALGLEALSRGAAQVTLGELRKYVALSARRFDAVGCGTATARGAPGERVEVTFLVRGGGGGGAWTVRVVEATMPASGVVKVSV